MKTYIVMYLIKSRKCGRYGWHVMEAKAQNKKEAFKAVRQAVKTIFGCNAFRCYAGKGEKEMSK